MDTSPQFGEHGLGGLALNFAAFDILPPLFQLSLPGDLNVGVALVERTNQTIS